jgi:AbrB family looped-hinge helix DNA binding protein
MATVKVSAKGWVVVPKEIRDRYGIEEGGSLHLLVLGDLIALVPAAPDPLTAARGMLRGGPSLVRQHLEERRRELEREEQGLPAPREDE